MAQQKQKLTKEQKFFIMGKLMLSKYDEIKAKRPLTAKEEQDVSHIKDELWKKIYLYAKKLCYKRMSHYRLDSDAYADALQACALKFFACLDEYDPYRHTPTTYFMYRFQEAISVYIRKYSQHLTQNDANNLTKVREAIHYYESKGITPDIYMLAKRANLSVKVTKQTLKIAQNSIRVDIDSCFDLVSNIPTPEDAFIKNEMSDAMTEALRNTLTNEELNFFLAKMNFNGSKERTYKDMERLYPDIDVKAYYSKIIGKLANNATLQSFSNAKKSHKPRLNLHNNEADAVEQNIIDFFS